VLYQKPSREEEALVSKIKRARKDNRKTLSRVQYSAMEEGKVSENINGNVSEDIAC
jgi:hypothetical protein